jgi:hypothetical protein
VVRKLTDVLSLTDQGEGQSVGVLMHFKQHKCIAAQGQFPPVWPTHDRLESLSHEAISIIGAGALVSDFSVAQASSL